MNDKQNLNIQGATGILPELNLIDNVGNSFSAVSPLVRWLRESNRANRPTITQGDGSNENKCGIIKTVQYNGFDIVKDGCNNVIGDLSICSNKVFSIARVGYKYCDPCAAVNDVITRKSGDLTGDVFQAGDSITETQLKLIEQGYQFTVNQSTVLGDPTNTASTIAPFESISSIYQSANGINVVNGSGVPVWKAIKIASLQNEERGFKPMGKRVWLVNRATYLRAQEEMRSFTTNLLTSDNPYLGIEFVVDNHIPTVAGATVMYELEFGNVGLEMIFDAPKSRIDDTDECGKRCVYLENYGGVYALNPCALSMIVNVSVQAPRYAQSLMPQVYC